MPNEESKSSIPKIKLVLSDLHLGRGRLIDGRTNPLEEFFYEEKFIEFIDYYTSGKFRDYEIELVINGDFLNFLQVDYQGHFLTVITEDVALQMLKSIVKGQNRIFNALKDFTKSEQRSITYIVGNHDQAMLFPKLRDEFNKSIADQARFKNIAYSFDGIHIEHGHMHESANRLNPKKFFLKKGLPEPILNLPFGSHFFIDFVMKIKKDRPHINKIRPFNQLIRWSIINETIFTLITFSKLVLYFIKMTFTKSSTRQFSMRKVIQSLFESAIFPDLKEAAYKLLNQKNINTVIFGHTYVYDYRQWAKGKEYFNTGTWTQLTSLDIKSLGKITKLTYVLIEYNNNEPLCRLKEWKGYHKVEDDVVVV